MLITFTVILVLVSLGLLGLGILIIIKEDLLLGGFKQSIKDKVKDAPKVAGSKGREIEIERDRERKKRGVLS